MEKVGKKIMELSVQEIIEIFANMWVHGVAVYGAGIRGAYIIEALEKKGFCINAVGDKQIGKICGKFNAVSLENLCERESNAVCIITPKESVQDIWEKLRGAFSVVIDYSEVTQILRWMDYFVPRNCSEMQYVHCHPFNHYESPYIQDIELKAYRENTSKDELLELDLNADIQKKFLPQLLQYDKDFFQKQREQQEGFRYQSDNGWFDDADAGLLHSMIREYEPKRIIEIGSGFSTCVMLDTNEYWLGNTIDITCIEPYPERLQKHVKSNDKLNIRKEFIQNIPLEEFDVLEKNDILFIDSSHVAKIGGDVLLEYFQILPRLKEGVLIHIHDIVYPFTYPEPWVLQGRAYTEAFILRAFLMNNSKYEILFFNSMMAQVYKDEYERGWDPKRKMAGGSIWLRKCSRE